MASCAGFDCGEGKSAREEANLWSSSLKDLLSSSDGRVKFKNYLDENGFEDEANTVDFWEKCNDTVTEYNKLKKMGKSRKHDPDDIAKFVSKAKEVINYYVDSRLINLDEGQIKKLKDCTENDSERVDPKNIYNNFHEARDYALVLLKDVHTFFADHLNRKYN